MGKQSCNETDCLSNFKIVTFGLSILVELRTSICISRFGLLVATSIIPKMKIEQIISRPPHKSHIYSNFLYAANFGVKSIGLNCYIKGLLGIRCVGKSVQSKMYTLRKVRYLDCIFSACMHVVFSYMPKVS